jgi:hypothetical protein
VCVRSPRQCEKADNFDETAAPRVGRESGMVRAVTLVVTARYALTVQRFQGASADGWPGFQHLVGTSLYRRLRGRNVSVVGIGVAVCVSGTHPSHTIW